MKYFRMSYEEVVFNRSYINIMLLNRSIPSFNIDKDDFGSRRKQKRKERRSEKPITKKVSASDYFMQFM